MHERHGSRGTVTVEPDYVFFSLVFAISAIYIAVYLADFIAHESYLLSNPLTITNATGTSPVCALVNFAT